MRFNRDQRPDDITPEQFKLLRLDLGFSIREWARALGFTGRLSNVSLAIRRMEAGSKEISPSTRRLCLMYARYGIPPDMLPPDDLTLGREEDIEMLEERSQRRASLQGAELE